MRGVYRFVQVSSLFLKQSQGVDVSREGNRSIFVEVIGEGVEVTRGRGNFDTLTKQKKKGSRCWQMAKMPMPTSRP